MTGISLRADCARCAALCCVALAFDRSELFGLDKAAAEPCPHLTRCGRCAIHASRAERGFRGCVDYDCQGAGPRVTQVLFGGRSWLEDPSLIGPMVAAFAVVRRAHELLGLLRVAGRLPLSPADRRRLEVLEAALEAAGGSASAVAGLARETHGFLRGLRHYVAAAPATGGTE